MRVSMLLVLVTFTLVPRYQSLWFEMCLTLSRGVEVDNKKSKTTVTLMCFTPCICRHCALTNIDVRNLEITEQKGKSFLLHTDVTWCCCCCYRCHCHWCRLSSLFPKSIPKRSLNSQVGLLEPLERIQLAFKDIYKTHVGRINAKTSVIR